MKLFTIGDSISQGFMSLAAARTELSYSTLIARCLGLVPGDNYQIPLWGAGGLPLNMETVLRNLERRYGSDISGIIEWARATLAINEMIDNVEEYYERGRGGIAVPQAGATSYYPNVSVAGFTVADAWKVTPKWCLKRLASDEPVRGLHSKPKDGFFTLPNRPVERIAHAVLNPSRNPKYNEFSQLRWLQFHAEQEGVDNCFLWLGSNNALGTVVRLRIDETDTRYPPLNLSVEERDNYNLWRPEHFEEEYDELLRCVHVILTSDKNKQPDCRVFIGTIPPVTIAPLAKGVGSELDKPDPFEILEEMPAYYEYYTFVTFGLDYARRGHRLTRDEAYKIDQYVAQYNQSIKELVDKYNKKSEDEGKGVRYVVVDIADQLLKLAFKRNHGKPTYAMPNEVIEKAKQLERPGPPNTVYYHVDRHGAMLQGGIFSLDGVHPSAIGQGLVAHEFIIKMKEAGVNVPYPLQWDAIFASDSLYMRPIALMPELYENSKLAEFVLNLVDVV